MIDQSQQSRNENIPMQESPDSHKTPQYTPVNNPDEINLLEYIYVLVKNKWWIIGAMVIGIIGGYIAANVKGPTYVSEAVIAAKENENKSASGLSGLGAFSGLVASQFNIGGDPGLDKIDLILGSRKFSAEMVEKYALLPQVIKNLSPKTYEKWYDSSKTNWKKDFVKPKTLLIGSALSSVFLKKKINKNNTMTISVESKDSTFSDTLLAQYLQYLNVFIQTSVQTDARENVSYLENQLIATVDPLLREKFQSMIASEIEKTMLVSKEAFRIIDPQISSMQFKEKKRYPLMFGIGLFFLSILIAVICHVVVSQEKTIENKKYLSKIRRELWLKG